MKDMIFTSSELTVKPRSNDYVLDYLNFEEFDFVRDTSVSNSLSSEDNLALRCNIPVKNREGCNALRNSPNYKLKGAFDFNQRVKDIKKKDSVTSKDTKVETNFSSSEDGENNTVQQPAISPKKYKFIKRNCDLGIDTSADPELKPSAINFVRKRGKPINKHKLKKKALKYKVNTPSVQSPTKFSDRGTVFKLERRPTEIDNSMDFT